MTSEKVLELVEAKMAERKSPSCLQVLQAMDAVVGSFYRRQKKSLLKDQETCTYCGTKGHGQNFPTNFKRKKCPAFGTKCNYCNRDHPLERVCRSKYKANQQKYLK